MLKLMGQSGLNSGLEIEVLHSPFSIGRKEGNALRLHNPYISKFHAQIQQEESGQYWITDLGSTNGTYLNQQPVKTRTPLNDGNIILFGKNEIFKVILSTVDPLAASGHSLEIAAHLVSPSLSAAQASANPADAANLSSAWTNLIDLAADPIAAMEFQDREPETETYSAPKMLWPDVVKLKTENEIYRHILEIAIDLFQHPEIGEVISSLTPRLRKLILFENGLIVLQPDRNNPATWQTYPLMTMNQALWSRLIEIQPTPQGSTKVQLLADPTGPNRVLYQPLIAAHGSFGCFVLQAGAEAAFSYRDYFTFQSVGRIVAAGLFRFYGHPSIS